jgi:hypothetical protein
VLHHQPNSQLQIQHKQTKIMMMIITTTTTLSSWLGRDADFSSHILPRSRMSRSYTPLPFSACIVCMGQFYIIIVIITVKKCFWMGRGLNGLKHGFSICGSVVWSLCLVLAVMGSFLSCECSWCILYLIILLLLTYHNVMARSFGTHQTSSKNYIKVQTEQLILLVTRNEVTLERPAS